MHRFIIHEVARRGQQVVGTKAVRRGLAAAIVAAAACAPVFGDDGQVALQGQGPKREALTAMQYKPFDASLLSGLTGWTNGPAASGETIKGRALLIVAWASWFKGSFDGLGDARAMADEFGHMGLDVVAVHHQRGFDGAAKILEQGKHSIRVAHDQKGELFKALRIEGAGPEYYFVDRAGRLRFAQVDRGSVRKAAELLVKESPSEAAAATAPTPKSGGDAGAGAGAGGAWKQPEEAAYTGAAWPARNRDVGPAKNVQGKKLPASMGQETWIGDKPELGGRVIVLDFWATWCGPCIAASPILEELQTSHKDDLVIVGMSGQKRPGRPEDVAAIKAFLEKKPTKYFHANDLKQTVYKSLDIKAIPHVVVLSTDGTVRWQGNPHDPDFRKAVTEVIKVDPGVKARKS